MEHVTAARHSAILLLMITGLPVQAQEVGPPIPRITPPSRCSDTPAERDEVVVCGESPENSPYRVPRQFRNQESYDDRDASWTTRIQDEAEIERFSSQNVGPAGMSRRSRQIDCEWRVARQQARGERPDCTRQINKIPVVQR